MHQSIRMCVCLNMGYPHFQRVFILFRTSINGHLGVKTPFCSRDKTSWTEPSDHTKRFNFTSPKSTYIFQLCELIMICRFAHFNCNYPPVYTNLIPGKISQILLVFCGTPHLFSKPFENTRVSPGVHGAHSAPFSMADSSTFPGTTQLLHLHLERLQPLDLQSLVFASAAVALGIIEVLLGPWGWGKLGFYSPPLIFETAATVHGPNDVEIPYIHHGFWGVVPCFDASMRMPRLTGSMGSMRGNKPVDLTIISWGFCYLFTFSPSMR